MIATDDTIGVTDGASGMPRGLRSAALDATHRGQGIEVGLLQAFRFADRKGSLGAIAEGFPGMRTVEAAA